MPSDGQDKTVWNASGRLGVGGGAYVRGSVGTSFRLPSAYELYVIDPCCERGNPDLVGEESFNVEGGFGARREHLDWEVTLFHRTVDDLIAIDFDRPEFPDGLIVNTDQQVEVLGWEAVLGFRFTDSVSATLSHLHNRAEEEGSSEQIPDVPADLSKLSLTWRPGSLPLALIGSAQRVGELFDTAGGGIGRVEHGDYTLFDLAASYTFAERHRIRLRLDNVFDEEYDTRVLRVRRDVDGSSYAAGTLGLPRTFAASYTLLF
jgi:vitamin B12 transporter